MNPLYSMPLIRYFVFRFIESRLLVEDAEASIIEILDH